MKHAARIFLFINSALLVSLFVMCWLRREARFDMMRSEGVIICFPIGPSFFEVSLLVCGLAGLVVLAVNLLSGKPRSNG